MIFPADAGPILPGRWACIFLCGGCTPEGHVVILFAMTIGPLFTTPDSPDYTHFTVSWWSLFDEGLIYDDWLPDAHLHFWLGKSLTPNSSDLDDDWYSGRWWYRARDLPTQWLMRLPLHNFLPDDCCDWYCLPVFYIYSVLVGREVVRPWWYLFFTLQHSFVDTCLMNWPDSMMMTHFAWYLRWCWRGDV